jgi:CheY-like chemotaxis protein
VIPLEEAIDAAIETSRPMIEAKRHALTVERPAHPVWVNADRVRLAQIFTNLLTNAAKYTDTGGSIRVRIQLVEQKIRIVVQDNGIGLSNEALARVFEMFSQLTPAIERSQGGLGIGLALVKGLVELHGGQVSARSPGVGLGSEFAVELPIVDPAASNAPIEDADAATENLISGRKILIADDNRDTAQSFAALLELEGAQTHTAFSGLEALEVAKKFEPDIALLDIGMPEINGYELAALLRAESWGRKLLLVAMTGWGHEQDKHKARAAGFDAHLTKPVHLSQILAVIDEHTRK